MRKRTWFMMMCSVVIVTLFAYSGVAAAALEYKEAPLLAEKVAAGELPPVEERLPENPLVVTPNAEIGQYGGTWRTGLRGGDDHSWLFRTIGYEQLLRWDIDFTKVIPNVAESFEANEDSSAFTFKLRKGMKWSDGEPFTADDILFAYELMEDTEVRPEQPSWFKVNGELGTVEKIDDYTVVFKFTGPNGLFIQTMATPSGEHWTIFPKHVVSKYWKKYNPDGVEALAKELGYTDTVAMMQARAHDNAHFYFEYPSLQPWQLTSGYSGNSTMLVAERNPYYFKVDPEGNQLPYIDRVVYDIGDDRESLVLKALAGEIDMMDRHINQPTNKAIFFDNQEKGGYHFFNTIPGSMNHALIALNLTHYDPVKREILQNKDFRIGLSHAINRQEIIDLVYLQGIPYQASPRPESPFYNERLATQYTEYNVDLANEYLDKAGYTERDADGFRLGPDGKRISIVIEVSASSVSTIDAIDLVCRYWGEVGVEAILKVEDRSILYERTEANEHDAAVWGGDGGLELFFAPQVYFPCTHQSNYGILWQRWFNDLDGAEEPPASVKKQIDLWWQIQGTADKEKQAAYMKELLEISADNFYLIGLCLPGMGYGIVKNNMYNVPETMVGSWKYPTPGPTNPEQYFYK